MAETAVRTPATVFLLPPSFLKTEDQQTVIPVPDSNTQIWTQEQHYLIVQTLMNYGCEYVKGREEYTLLKQILIPESFTEGSNFGKQQDAENPLITRLSGTGVISPICGAKGMNDTEPAGGLEAGIKPKAFLAPLDIQTNGSIAEVIPSFRVIQSKSLRLNIGFDTEFQNIGEIRRILSLQMSIALGQILLRYFFLVDPRYQEIKAESGGMIPLKYCLADILADLKKCYFRDFPLVLKKDIVYKEKSWKGHDPFRLTFPYSDARNTMSI